LVESTLCDTPATVVVVTIAGIEDKEHLQPGEPHRLEKVLCGRIVSIETLHRNIFDNCTARSLAKIEGGDLTRIVEHGME
jgi:hypothetical protein